MNISDTMGSGGRGVKDNGGGVTDGCHEVTVTNDVTPNEEKKKNNNTKEPTFLKVQL